MSIFFELNAVVKSSDFLFLRSCINMLNENGWEYNSVIKGRYYASIDAPMMISEKSFSVCEVTLNTSDKKCTIDDSIYQMYSPIVYLGKKIDDRSIMCVITAEESSNKNYKTLSIAIEYDDIEQMPNRDIIFKTDLLNVWEKVIVLTNAYYANVLIEGEEIDFPTNALPLDELQGYWVYISNEMWVANNYCSNSGVGRITHLNEGYLIERLVDLWKY